MDQLNHGISSPPPDPWKRQRYRWVPSPLAKPNRIVRQHAGLDSETTYRDRPSNDVHLGKSETQRDLRRVVDVGSGKG
jgi:hypothetical protein